MKKLILTLALIMSAQASFAYLEEGRTVDPSLMQHSGYSQAILKMVDREIESCQGREMNYVRYYKDYKPANFLTAFYTKAKIYVDPAQEDDFFGKHEVDMKNAWFSDMHDSAVKKRVKTKKVESL